MNATNFLRAAKVICFLVLMCLPCALNAQSEMNDDWWSNNTIIAKGYGAPPKSDDQNISQGRSLARRAATLDAYRQLAEQVKGVHITAETTINDQILTGDIVETKVEALIRGSKILSEEFKEDGTCVIVMALPVYGAVDSVANVAFKPVDKEDFPTPSAPIKAQGNYTGLIIDCGDSDLKPVLAPVIRNAANISIYSYSNLDYDKVILNGVVGYVKGDTGKQDNSILLMTSYNRVGKNVIFLNASAPESNISRAGSNPLIIKASAMTDGDSCPVVSQEDADRILAENAASHFLDEGAVVFTSYRVGGVRA